MLCQDLCHNMKKTLIMTAEDELKHSEISQNGELVNKASKLKYRKKWNFINDNIFEIKIGKNIF